MKNATVTMLTLAVLAATMFLSTAYAQQNVSGTEYRAHIPFQFQLAGKTLPAGNYVVKVTDHFVQVRNTESNKGVGIATLRTDRKQASEKDMLEFNVYGNQYFLANVWSEGSQNGRELIRSKAEIEMAKNGIERHVQLALNK